MARRKNTPVAPTVDRERKMVPRIIKQYVYLNGVTIASLQEYIDTNSALENIRFAADDYYDHTDISIVGDSIETDDEYARRIKQEERIVKQYGTDNEKTRIRELLELERLQKKYKKMLGNVEDKKAKLCLSTSSDTATS